MTKKYRIKTVIINKIILKAIKFTVPEKLKPVEKLNQQACRVIRIMH